TLPHTYEPLQRGERRISISGAAAGKRVLMAYHAPAVGDTDFAAFLVLQEILSGSSGVNFLQNDWGTPARPGRLLHGSIAGISSWYPPSEQQYLFVVGGSIEDGASESSAEQAIETGIATLRDTPIKKETVETAIGAVLDELVFDIQTTEDAAHQLASFAAMGALDELLTLPQRIESVSPADVMAVAQIYLRPEQRTIAWYRPGDAPAAPAREVEVARDLPVAPLPAGNIDTSPVGPVEVRRLSGGIPALVLASDLSPSVDLRVVIPLAGQSADGFVSHAPIPGASTWYGRERSSRLVDLIERAASALHKTGPATPAGATRSTDPETRMSEEFLALSMPTAPPEETTAPAVVVISGDVDTEQTFAILEDTFGALERGAVQPYARPAIPTGRKSVSLDLPIAQSQLGYIVAAPAPSAPDYLASRLLLYVLAHGYEGRLGKEAISNRGLAYYIDGQYSSAGGAGWITLSIGVDTDKIGALEKLLAGELARLETSPPTDAEVEEAKRHLLGRALSAAQSNDELTASLARHWLWHERVPSITELETQLDNISHDDVLAIIPAFVDGMTIAVTP
ncbi:MAG: insulinase family protein, partial [Gammaproteobacteria bacterium]